MKTAIKMRDIAGELGVSTVTVSKALAGKDGVGRDLRDRILQKAQELGYVYNSLPRNMLKGRHYNIGILIAAKYLGESSFYWVFYQELLLALKQSPYLGVLEIISPEDEAKNTVPALVAARKVDGVILLGQMPAPYITMLTTQITECVFLDFYSDIGSRDCVASNNFLGSYNLTKLLIDAGHKKIGFIGSTAATTSILDRYLGFCKAMMEAGLPVDPAIEDRDCQGMYIKLMINPAVHTAYVCNNDQIAGILINQLRESGLKIPDDVSIVGFDNESELVTGGVGVTSLALNTAGMSELTVNLLIQQIESPAYTVKGRSFIDGRIVIKQSIAAPRKEDRPAATAYRQG
ncbi:MAG: LacI family DNA-binding transcriptional regulator [Treponema sp.]|jgi:LacI family transcriptional regulator|nr:LacI family DNA-binding transcriptional regulator [Treponema sp.]